MNKEFSVLTIADDLLYFNTLEEAENYTKGFPIGTYQISQEGIGVIK